MCGIVGILSPDRDLAPLLPALRERLAHRGPDGAGAWFSADGRVALGHRRLAIIDPSSRADQPFLSTDGRHVLVYNGEIYNFRAVRQELERRGHRFRTESDTEVLVTALAAQGSAALDPLAGQWALALWDTAERTLFCARDRLGEKPFYFAELGGDFVFASELKAIAAHPAFRPELDERALVDYLTFGFVADPKTIFSAVQKLSPGSRMTVRFPSGESPRAGAQERWWRFRPAPAAEAGTPEEVRATLERVALETTIADVPVGAFLSGGVDSSSVVTALARGGRRLTAYTVGFEEDAWDETRFAREVAQRADMPHVVSVLRAEEALREFDRLLWHFDEPFADYSSLPTYVLCREARKGVTVALSGDGADEAFGGYRRYQRLARRVGLRSTSALRGAARVLGALSDLAGPRGGRTLRQYAGEDADVLCDMLSVVAPAGELRRLARGPLRAELDHYDPRDLVREHLAALPDDTPSLDRMRALDLALTLGAGILVKVDRASMAVSLEVRPVYVHRDMLQLAARIPAARLADRGRAKIPLRDAFRPWFAADFLERRKQGFALPLPQWIREGAGPFGELRCLPRLQDRIDGEAFLELVRAHREGRRDATALMYAVVVLDRWIDLWVLRGGAHDA